MSALQTCLILGAKLRSADLTRVWGKESSPHENPTAVGASVGHHVMPLLPFLGLDDILLDQDPRTEAEALFDVLETIILVFKIMSSNFDTNFHFLFTNSKTAFNKAVKQILFFID